MAETQMTSAERLDELLADGKISQDEHETLRRAIEDKEAEVYHTNSRPRLAKSSIDMRIGGVCAGLAERFGLPLWRVRLAPLVALWLTGAFAVMFGFTQPRFLQLPIIALFFLFGILAVMTYTVLYFMLPWKDDASAGGFKFPWKLSAYAFGFWFVAVMLPVKFVPVFAYTFQDIGIGSPLLAEIVIDLTRYFAYHWFTLLLIIYTVFGVDLVMPESSPARKMLALCAFWVLSLWLCSIALAFAIPTRILASFMDGS